VAQTDRMRAGFFLGQSAIELRETPIPTPGNGEVLLRVEACGVCGTDFHIYQEHLTDGVAPPVVLGHEIAARVETVGEGAEGLAPGQFCTVDPVIGCGHCDMCRSARPNLCSSPTIIGYKLNGGFAQYLTAPAEKVIPLDEAAGPTGGVLCETLACVINGLDKLNLRAGATAMVLGAGTVGLLWAQMLRHSPCSRIIQTETVEFRRRRARQLGVDLVIDPGGENLPERIRAELPDGVDFIIDATGVPAAIDQAIGLLARGGTFMIFGICPAGSSVRLDPFELYNKEARILASKMPPATLPRAARLIESGMIACDRIVTAILPLGKLEESVAGFETHRDSQIKVAINPWA